MKIPQRKSLQQKLQDKNYFLKETALMTATGSYSGNLRTGFCFMDEIGKEILHLPDDFHLTFESAQTFFVNPKDASLKFQNCMEGYSFEQDVEMVDYDGKRFWARATGKPLIDETSEKIVGIRGVFTSIDRFVRQGKELEKNAKVIEVQNERLLHFAHIVSHNLRSHASNLELTLETFKDSHDTQDQIVFNRYLHEISLNLSKTLEHLNEVVTVNTHSKSRKLIDLEIVFEEVLEEYQPFLNEIDATVYFDFSELPQINYVYSFVKSIFSNLLSNAIKYRDHSKVLEIKLTTLKKGSKNLMKFKDNGIGIDLEKNGSKIFNMYKTFHDNADARGIGLFITKNQVESLGGDIFVKSMPGKGSTFTVKF